MHTCTLAKLRGFVFIARLYTWQLRTNFSVLTHKYFLRLKPSSEQDSQEHSTACLPCWNGKSKPEWPMTSEYPSWLRKRRLVIGKHIMLVDGVNWYFYHENGVLVRCTPRYRRWLLNWYSEWIETNQLARTVKRPAIRA